MGTKGQKSYWLWGMPIGLLGAWSHIHSCVTKQVCAGANASLVLFSDVCTVLSKGKTVAVRGFLLSEENTVLRGRFSDADFKNMHGSGLFIQLAN